MTDIHPEYQPPWIYYNGTIWSGDAETHGHPITEVLPATTGYGVNHRGPKAVIPEPVAQFILERVNRWDRLLEFIEEECIQIMELTDDVTHVRDALKEIVGTQ